MINILQIGFGPLGIQTVIFIAKKEQVKTVAVLDINRDLYGKSLYEITDKLDKNVHKRHTFVLIRN